ncbi:uncharacterized protein LTR77_000923 [Saxophila tyrrhenica]|uniref:Uncharacterized protein n=1 Tax=Saxophila tyrrhenica TaxID=1690608 RepID=A0AAV9PTX0_9PEZI|nr:hypothetical protein LTR77_000923 [Saxophila tyrrhenica]
MAQRQGLFTNEEREELRRNASTIYHYRREYDKFDPADFPTLSTKQKVIKYISAILANRMTRLKLDDAAAPLYRALTKIRREDSQRQENDFYYELELATKAFEQSGRLMGAMIGVCNAWYGSLNPEQQQAVRRNLEQAAEVHGID